MKLTTGAVSIRHIWIPYCHEQTSFTESWGLVLDVFHCLHCSYAYWSLHGSRLIYKLRTADWQTAETPRHIRTWFSLTPSPCVRNEWTEEKALEKQGVPDRQLHQAQQWPLSVMELKQRATAAAAAHRDERLQSLKNGNHFSPDNTKAKKKRQF